MKPLDMVLQEFNKARNKAELLGAWPFSDLDTYDKYYKNTDIVRGYVKLWESLCAKYGYNDPFTYHYGTDVVFLRCKGDIPVTYDNPIPIFVKEIDYDAFQYYKLDSVELELDFDKCPCLFVGGLFTLAPSSLNTVKLKIRCFTRDSLCLDDLFEGTKVSEIYIEELAVGSLTDLRLRCTFSSPHISKLDFQSVYVNSYISNSTNIFAKTRCFIDASWLHEDLFDVIKGVNGTIDASSCSIDISVADEYCETLVSEVEKNGCTLIAPYSLKQYESALGSRIMITEQKSNSCVDVKGLARDELQLYKDFKNRVSYPNVYDVERLIFEWTKLCYKYNYKDPLVYTLEDDDDPAFVMAEAGYTNVQVDNNIVITHFAKSLFLHFKDWAGDCDFTYDFSSYEIDELELDTYNNKYKINLNLGSGITSLTLKSKGNCVYNITNAENLKRFSYIPCGGKVKFKNIKLSNADSVEIIIGNELQARVIDLDFLYGHTKFFTLYNHSIAKNTTITEVRLSNLDVDDFGQHKDHHDNVLQGTSLNYLKECKYILSTYSIESLTKQNAFED